MEMQYCLTGTQINKIFTVGQTEIQALRNIEIEIPREKLTIFKGRSGSGKTTLMNILSALDTPTSGRVIFEEKELTAMSGSEMEVFRKNNVGFVFQSVALMGNMNAYENVEFGMRIAGEKNHKVRKDRAIECLDMVGLSKRMYHMPSEMSGGEQQRVAIARAIAHKPQILFADEPTAELDTATGLQVLKLFQMLIEKEKTTVIMTTHDPAMMDMADKIYTLEDGEIIE